MKKPSTLALLCYIMMFGFAIKTRAQCSQAPCTVPEAFLDASSACILNSEHELDCYFGFTWDSPILSLPPFWCTSIENNQWFAFRASSTAVRFNIGVENCAAGDALQAAILQTFDCASFEFVSDCYDPILDGASIAVENNVPLVPGNVYYLMIDGSAGAKCDFTINAASITAGHPAVCLPIAPVEYSASEAAQWSIQPPGAGTIIGANPAQSVLVQWNQPGIAQICAQSVACSYNDCMTVNVEASPADTITEYMCPGELVVCRGNTFVNPGFYEVHVFNMTGCDSIIYCDIIGVQPSFIDLGQIPLPCDGSFETCGTTFASLGNYGVMCQGWQGCDSTVFFELVPGDVLANAGSLLGITCDGLGQLTLDGTASVQGSGFAYLWTTADGHILGGEDTLTPTVDAAGSYCLTVTNLGSGCVMTDCVAVVFDDIYPDVDIAPATFPCDGSASIELCWALQVPASLGPPWMEAFSLAQTASSRP